MDDEQRKYFADLMATMEGVASDARAAASTSRETANAVRKLDGRVAAVEGSVAVLQKHVFGSDPPPSPPTRPMAESIGEHDGEIAHLSGQVIAARAELAEVKQQNAEQLEMLATITKALGNPMVRRVAYAVGSLIVAYAAAKGLVLK